MRIFGSERISGLMASGSAWRKACLSSTMVSKRIESAQRQVEGQNFDIRKHLLEYDDVMNKQRETIYGMRKEILEGKDMRSYVEELIGTIVDWHLDTYANKEKSPEDWDVEALKQALGTQFAFNLDDLRIDRQAIVYTDLREKIVGTLKALFEEKEKILSAPRMREFERIIMLQVIDQQWKDHLLGMDYLKEGIGLRGYGQRDPLVEYKKETTSVPGDVGPGGGRYRPVPFLYPTRPRGGDAAAPAAARILSAGAGSRPAPARRPPGPDHDPEGKKEEMRAAKEEMMLYRPDIKEGLTFDDVLLGPAKST